MAQFNFNNRPLNAPNLGTSLSALNSVSASIANQLDRERRDKESKEAIRQNYLNRELEVVNSTMRLEDYQAKAKDRQIRLDREQSAELQRQAEAEALFDSMTNPATANNSTTTSYSLNNNPQAMDNYVAKNSILDEAVVTTKGDSIAEFEQEQALKAKYRDELEKYNKANGVKPKEDSTGAMRVLEGIGNVIESPSVAIQDGYLALGEGLSDAYGYFTKTKGEREAINAKEELDRLKAEKDKTQPFMSFNNYKKDSKAKELEAKKVLETQRLKEREGIAREDYKVFQNDVLAKANRGETLSKEERVLLTSQTTNVPAAKMFEDKIADITKRELSMANMTSKQKAKLRADKKQVVSDMNSVNISRANKAKQDREEAFKIANTKDKYTHEIDKAMITSTGKSKSKALKQKEYRVAIKEIVGDGSGIYTKLFGDGTKAGIDEFEKYSSLAESYGIPHDEILAGITNLVGKDKEFILSPVEFVKYLQEQYNSKQAKGR